jgi:hypothetical protein
MQSQALPPGWETLSGPDGRSDERWKKDQISLTVDNGQVGSSCLAFFSLDIISEVSKVSSSFVESFTGSLVALLERLVANHLQEIGSEERPPGVPKLGGRVAVIHNQQPIPTCGILEDICAISRTKKFALNDSKSNDKSNFGLQGVPNLSTSLKSVVSCLKLICHSDLPYCFSKNRQVLMKTLGLILDSSDNIQLLLTAVGIVGEVVGARGSLRTAGVRRKGDFSEKDSIPRQSVYSFDCSTVTC